MVEEINPAGTPEPIHIPHPRCAAKGVKKAAALTMFGDLEISKGLRLGHENSIQVTVVGSKIGFPLNGAVHNPAITRHLKNAP